MSKLKASTRNKLPAKEFAGPNRSFPVENKVHARMAISGATRAEHAGNISSSEEAHIKSVARHKLGHQHEKPMNEHGHRHGGPHEHLSPSAHHFHKI